MVLGMPGPFFCPGLHFSRILELEKGLVRTFVKCRSNGFVKIWIQSAFLLVG
jgi:hypothetical protein